MIELKNITSGYAVPVLHDISLSFPKGQVTVIVGPNGCGKSTLLKTACRLIAPMSGSVFVDGIDSVKLKDTDFAKKVAYLPQSRNVPELTVGQLVLHGRYCHLPFLGRYGEKDRAAAQIAMERMDISDLSETLLSQLSGGQRQKAYLAMALAQDADTLFLDEPNTFLDIALQLQLLHQLKDLAREGKAVVLVLHDLSMALRFANRIVVMQNGRVVGVGTPEETAEILQAVFSVQLKKVEKNIYLSLEK